MFGRQTDTETETETETDYAHMCVDTCRGLKREIPLAEVTGDCKTYNVWFLGVQLSYLQEQQLLLNQ